MSMDKTTGILEKSSKSAAATGEGIIVKLGADDDHVAIATAVSDVLVGVTVNSVSAAEGALTIQMNGVASVKAGGSVTRGNYVTTNGSGQGVAASPSAGVNNNVIGIALKSAASGDLFPVLLSVGRIQG